MERCITHNSSWVLDTCEPDSFAPGCGGLLGVDATKFEDDLLGLLDAITTYLEAAPYGRCA